MKDIFSVILFGDFLEHAEMKDFHKSVKFLLNKIL